ncbi:MAG: hypothetical protein J1G30_03380 [Spirochaetales bacterium]|nr:hypothetical protein [Spirochaetales bacterium]
MKLTHSSINTKVIFTLIFICTIFSSFASPFDNVKWEKSNSDKNVTLYYANGGDCNYYKTEAIVDKSYGYKAKDLMEILLNYKKYQEIFVKTMVFSPVKETDEGTVFYCRIDFSPMKDRDYHILMTVNDLGNTQILEWKPYNDADIMGEQKNCQRVNHVYGRWLLKDLQNGNISVSTEYYNNWKYKNLSLKTVTPFEKNVAFNNMKLFLRYISNTNAK